MATTVRKGSMGAVFSVGRQLPTMPDDHEGRQCFSVGKQLTTMSDNSSSVYGIYMVNKKDQTLRIAKPNSFCTKVQLWEPWVYWACIGTWVEGNLLEEEHLKGQLYHWKACPSMGNKSCCHPGALFMAGRQLNRAESLPTAGVYCFHNPREVPRDANSAFPEKWRLFASWVSWVSFLLPGEDLGLEFPSL